MDKETQNKKGKSAMAAGLAGAAVGALGVAAAYALSDRNTRDKINDKIDTTKEKSKEKVQQLKDKTKEVGQKAKDAVGSIKGQAAHTADLMDESVSNAKSKINDVDLT